MNAFFDIAIAGSGFAGSLIAMIARRLGLTVVLLERAHHPRVVVGESSTPLSNLLLETIAIRYDLPWLMPLTKWGTWQHAYPDVACGLKRGFTFFHHEPGVHPAAHGQAVDRQLLVAASPHDAVADTHWFRADLDTFLVEQAIAQGVVFLDHCEVRSGTRQNGTWNIRCATQDGQHQLDARLLLDATGPRGLLHRLLHLQNQAFPEFPATSALYSHFTGVAPFSGAQQYTRGTPPYPPEAAALHHVFPGGWMWVLHFNNGWTSAGFATSRAIADRFCFEEKQSAWQRLLDALPEIREQFADSTAVTPMTYVPQLSFRSSQLAGDGWAMLPSAAGFVDPLLSTGFPLTLLGILRLGAILERSWDTPALQPNLQGYAQETDGELLATADLIGAMYANMSDFATFRALSLLYFAAASYAETARRLNKQELAPAFLLHTHSVFGPGLRHLTARARQTLNADERLTLKKDILQLIQAFDVAGLTHEPADHCYPVCAADLMQSKDKVQASQDEILQLLHRSGFVDASVSGIVAPQC